MGIASIVLGAIKPGDCDYNDKMGLDVGEYLIGLGVASIVMSLTLAFLLSLMICGYDTATVGIIIIVVAVINALFGLAWFIVGAVILFRGNIDCIRDGSSHVIFALVLWCLSAFSLVKQCCIVTKQADSDA